MGSPHFSLGEFARLDALLPAAPFQVPFYVCTGRSEYLQLEAAGRLRRFEDAGVEIVVDTCVVVTPILPPKDGVLMTNSGKFAHYTPANTGYGVVYGSLEDCGAVGLARSGGTRRESVELKGDVVLKGAVVHAGSGEGRILLLEKPISFWGGVDPITGKITDPRHPRAVPAFPTHVDGPPQSAGRVEPSTREAPAN